MIQAGKWVWLSLVLGLACADPACAQGTIRTVPIEFSAPRDKETLTNASASTKSDPYNVKLERDLRARAPGAGSITAPRPEELPVMAPAPRGRVVRRTQSEPDLPILSEDKPGTDRARREREELTRELEYQLATGSRQMPTPQEREFISTLIGDRALNPRAGVAQSGPTMGEGAGTDTRFSELEQTINRLGANSLPGDVWAADRFQMRLSLQEKPLWLEVPNPYQPSAAGTHGIIAPWDKDNLNSTWAAPPRRPERSQSELLPAQPGLGSSAADYQSAFGAGATGPGSPYPAFATPGYGYQPPIGVVPPAGPIQPHQLQPGNGTGRTLPEPKRAPNGLTIPPKQQF